ncbi:MAG: Glu/Leu/Phe/Val dehydrogenase [Desulfurococcales archaeon]|nr:Glu/Leu/Phe/Val dehydrogenase [Desulfurococcales archaeon]
MSVAHDPYEEAKKQLRQSIEILGLSEEVYEVLAYPERLIRVRLPVRMDDGTVKVFLAWRSQHNSALGPYKGGIRYHPQVTENEVIALSMWMTWKNSLAGLPYGGGKGGIKVDPKKLSPSELERLSRAYFAAIADVVGIDQDIPAPDVYTNPQTMAWYFDEYSRIKRGQYFGVVTGKPLELGGLHTRVISTGYGTAVAAREAAKKVFGGVEGRTVAVQGFGNAGYYAAKFLAEMGAIVVAVSDSKGGIYNSKGLNIEEVKKVKDETGSVINYANIERKITNEELLELDVDILVPAAIENVITEANADKIKAKVISEAANGPTTPAAEEVLTKKGIVVVPDILANAGGVIVSHIEWVNNRMGGWIKEEEAKARLEEKMVNNFHAVWDFWQKRLDTSKYNMRAAAYAIAVERVYRAMKLRGWI